MQKHRIPVKKKVIVKKHHCKSTETLLGRVRSPFQLLIFFGLLRRGAEGPSRVIRNSDPGSASSQAAQPATVKQEGLRSCCSGAWSLTETDLGTGNHENGTYLTKRCVSPRHTLQMFRDLVMAGCHLHLKINLYITWIGNEIFFFFPKIRMILFDA